MRLRVPIAVMALCAGWGAALPACAQTPLPTAWTGPWELGYPPAGWTFSGLGLDYHPDYDGLNDGAAKFQNSGAFIAIHFSDPPAAVSYWIRGLSFSGGVFRVEQSVDGVEWDVLRAYTHPPATATHEVLVPSAEARRIRFIYTEKLTGNIGLDGISIAKGGWVQPVIDAIREDAGAVVVAVQESVMLRTYVLEQAARLDAPPWVEWAPVDEQPGRGGPLELGDPAPAGVMRFYRVRDATPGP
jgi:hypothetical protein